jgi:DNA-binding response OmpR family regulator
MRALVIEDDEMTNQLFVEALGDCGYEACGVISAEDAVRLWSEGGFHLVTLDVGLPGASGLEFCRWLRLQDGGEDAFVMAITGHDEPEDLRVILDAGADDYLPKPTSMDLLLVRLAIADKQLTDRLERRRAEALSQHSVQCFQALQDLCSDAVLTIDREEDRILTVNPSVGRLLGWAHDQLPRRRAEAVFPEWDRIKQAPESVTRTRAMMYDGSLVSVDLRAQGLWFAEVNAVLCVFSPSIEDDGDAS